MKGNTMQHHPLSRRTIVIGTGLLTLTGLVAAGFHRRQAQGVPAGLDFTAQRLSANGLYRVAYTSQPSPVPVNRLHSWTLHIERPDGSPLNDAPITVDGDMPEHGHGLPTRPRVTRQLGPGDYLVEGVKFQMGGWWVMDFTVAHNGRTDTTRFNLMLSN